ncbi:hypothetical protein G9F75_07175 [Bacillus sp. EKM208B]|uniref:hypothetical protein n=1 Tax=Bacillus TaxID=1386 RepID=UPI00142D3324|nr:hypothetical protein [Bacillus sp. EKM208B]KAF6538680.1 hypothetical protein G9F75_07175 [Bacillus sp. EKM208B]
MKTLKPAVALLALPAEALFLFLSSLLLFILEDIIKLFAYCDNPRNGKYPVSKLIHLTTS